MPEDSYIYIARHICLCHDSRGSRTYAEACFSDWNSAREWLRNWEEPDPTDEISPHFRNTITKVPMDQLNYMCDAPVETWTFLLNGELHGPPFDANNQIRDFERWNFTGRFTVGDIVRVLSNLQEPRSSFTDARIAVVQAVSVEEQEDWVPDYIVWYVNECAAHAHLPEVCLEPVESFDATRERFVVLLSKVLRGELSAEISDKVYKAMASGISVSSPTFWDEMK